MKYFPFYQEKSEMFKKAYRFILILIFMLIEINIKKSRNTKYISCGINKIKHPS